MPTTKRTATPNEPVAEGGVSAPEPKSATTPPTAPATASSVEAVEQSAEPDAGLRAAEDGDGEGGGLGRWVKRLVRLVVLLALVVGVGTGIYYGWPIVYDRVIAPVQTNTSDLGALRDRIAQLEAQVTELGATDASIQADIAGLDGRLSDHERRLEALDAMDATLATNNDAVAESALRQVRLLKGMELMSRARLFLYQSNFGLAEQDLKAARDLLSNLASGGDVDGQAVVALAVERLDRAIDALPVFPVTASGELDIAWQALLGRVPTPSDGDTEPTPEPAPTPTPTPTPAP